MTKKVTARPLELNGKRITLGIKLYSVSQKEVYKYASSRTTSVEPWTGNISAKIEEYTVVWLNEAENSRSFKVKSSKGCEESFTFKYCDRTLESMNFSFTVSEAVNKAISLEKAHIAKAEKSIKGTEEIIRNKKGILMKKKKGLALLKKNISKMHKTLKVCQSC